MYMIWKEYKYKHIRVYVCTYVFIRHIIVTVCLSTVLIPDLRTLSVFHFTV